MKVLGGRLGCRVLFKGTISFFWIHPERTAGSGVSLPHKGKIIHEQNPLGKRCVCAVKHGHALGTSSVGVPACRTCSRGSFFSF